MCGWIHQGRGALARPALLALLWLIPFFSQSASAREGLRVADLPRDFQSWAIWRADDASLSETAKGPLPGQAFHGADFCFGAMLDAGMGQGIVGGLPLHGMAFCPIIFVGFRTAGLEARAIKPVSGDRPITNVPIVSQTMCSPAIRQR